MAELTFDQLLYGWSESNAAGRRGFGVIAMSEGWRELLAGGEGVLGPLVAYPEAGRRGEAAPAHGGYARVRGLPVLFRRLPSVADALNRPGNYCVHVLLPAPGTDLDSAAAAGLLQGAWLTTPLPAPQGPRLPIVQLAAPGRRGSAPGSAQACGAVLQGLQRGKPTVLSAQTETEGRAALCDAIRRLPAALAAGLTFSTLESEPDRTRFDASVVVSGWAVPPGAGASPRIPISGDAREIDQQCARWGRLLARSGATALKGLPEPITVLDIGLRLDALEKLAGDPSSLEPPELISVLSSPQGQAWAGESAAPPVVRRIVSGMDPALGPDLARAARRRPAVTELLTSAGWDVLSEGRGGRNGAQTLLLGLGESASAIELADLSSRRGSRLSAEDSARYLSLVADRGLAGDRLAARVAWTPDLMHAHPHLWFEALTTAPQYQGPRADQGTIKSLDVRRIGAILSAAHEGGLATETMAGRLWRGLPAADRERVALLRKVAASSEAGLGVVFDAILTRQSLGAQVRAPLLREFWPILVRELRLPAYLADDLRPVGASAPVPVLVAALVALVLAAAGLGWVLG